ncbi:heat shock protein Hsp20 [Alicyclobacillus hesperidum URH17-3-68]|uniref:HSP20 family protein n=1 Tax=Alicyclobacillus hesperidum TaxID=89784 RepID=A0A1H2VM48_9BACL|nr:Hsp20/alpha crystallin family protein [Alicyclobacillus hesperidum]EJY55695.1 heat shock protein Hsp20 [Alicyclobacillus hesperidum URH17-3-68]GLV12966.1 heat-shock protein Hsp20 [Alicyclobacillus hesperidum]SDW69455.1 HSP20 family protein [Alicyclobacillus hesperidum]
MTLVPYDPFGIMRRDFGSFPRLFDDDWFDNHFANMPRVRCDVRETQNEVIVTAEIPGLEKKEDVNITVHDNHLHLSGKIERMGEHKDENVHRMERYYGQFSRTVPLPTAVDDTGAKATYRNGILEVRIPKSQKQMGRQIDVDFH